jgi:hypothetical protein
MRPLTLLVILSVPVLDDVFIGPDGKTLAQVPVSSQGRTARSLC